MNKIRECGSCTLCCTTSAVPELSKPAGVKCTHCSTGCSIYNSRPQSCRTFECAWLKGDMPDWMKPDLVNVLIEHLPDVPVVIALPKPGYETTWRTERVVDVLKKEYQEKGIAVVGSDRMVLVPDGRKVEEVMRDVYSAAKSLGAI